MALSYVRLELITDGVFSTGRVLEFSYSDYESFEYRFLKHFGDICSNREFKDLIKNTDDFEELEFVFFDSNDWELKITKNQKEEREEMELKLVDVETNPHEGKVDTCEFYMDVEMVNEPVFVFKKDNGELVRVRAFIWSWGFYDEEDIEDIVDLAAYTNGQEFDEERELDYSRLANLIYEYKYGKD